ncbi:MAG TPA: tetratricopeptide repeat protein, partial [Asticcacaulis sp.]
DAIEAFSQSLELHSDNPEAREGRIRAYEINKQPDKALADAQIYVRLNPDSSDSQQMLARVLLTAKKYDEALDAYRKAAALAPDDADLLNEFGDQLTRCNGATGAACDKQHAEALAIYDKVIAIEPTAHAYIARSQVRPPLDFDLKKKDIDAALSMSPDDDYALTARASLLLAQKNYAAAVADATRVIDRPHTEYGETARKVRAYAYGYLKQYDLALADWDALIAASPDEDAYLNGRAWLRATGNLDLDKALADVDAALKSKPDTAAYLDTRGFVELRMGRLDAALNAYTAALKLVPTQADSLYGRGLVERRQGQTKAGDADLAAARKIYPDIDKTFADYGMTP